MPARRRRSAYPAEPISEDDRTPDARAHRWPTLQQVGTEVSLHSSEGAHAPLRLPLAEGRAHPAARQAVRSQEATAWREAFQAKAHRLRCQLCQGIKYLTAKAMGLRLRQCHLDLPSRRPYLNELLLPFACLPATARLDYGDNRLQRSRNRPFVGRAKNAPSIPKCSILSFVDGKTD